MDDGWIFSYNLIVLSVPNHFKSQLLTKDLMRERTRLSWPGLTWHGLAKPMRLHTNPLSKYTESVAFTGCLHDDPHPVSLNPNESTTAQCQTARCRGGVACF